MPISINLGRINTCKIVGTKDRFIEVRCIDEAIPESWECDPVTGTCYDPGDGSGQWATEAACIAAPAYTNSCVDAGLPDSGVFGGGIDQYNWLVANGHFAVAGAGWYYESLGPPPTGTLCPGPNGGSLYTVSSYSVIDINGVPLFNTNIINDLVTYLAGIGITVSNTDSYNTIHTAIGTSGGVAKGGSLQIGSSPCVCQGCGSGHGASWDCVQVSGVATCQDPGTGAGQYSTLAACNTALAAGTTNTCDTNSAAGGARVNAAAGTIFATEADAIEYYTNPANGISGTDASTLFFEIALSALVGPCQYLTSHTTCCEGPNSTGANPTYMMYLPYMYIHYAFNSTPGCTCQSIAGQSAAGANICDCCNYATGMGPNNQPLSVLVGYCHPSWTTSADYNGVYGMNDLGVTQSWSWDELLTDAIAAGAPVTMNTPYMVSGNVLDPTAFTQIIWDWLDTNPAPYPDTDCHNCMTNNPCYQQCPNPNAWGGYTACNRPIICLSGYVCECEVVCRGESWDCDPATQTCYDPGTGLGPYTTQADCIAAGCAPPSESWECIDGTCVDPGNGTGQYATLADCLAGSGGDTCAGSVDNGLGPVGATGDKLSYNLLVSNGTTNVPFCNFKYESTVPAQPWHCEGPNGGIWNRPQGWEIWKQCVLQYTQPLNCSSTVDNLVAWLNTNIGPGFLNTMTWFQLEQHSYTFPGWDDSCGGQNIRLSHNPCFCSDCGPTDLYDCVPGAGCQIVSGGQYTTLAQCNAANAPTNTCDGTTEIPTPQADPVTAWEELTINYPTVDISTLSAQIITGGNPCRPPLTSNQTHCIGKEGWPMYQFGAYIFIDAQTGAPLTGLQASYTKWSDFLTDAQAIPIAGIGGATGFADACAAVNTHYNNGLCTTCPTPLDNDVVPGVWDMTNGSPGNPNSLGVPANGFNGINGIYEYLTTQANGYTGKNSATQWLGGGCNPAEYTIVPAVPNTICTSYPGNTCSGQSPATAPNGCYYVGAPTYTIQNFVLPNGPYYRNWDDLLADLVADGCPGVTLTSTYCDIKFCAGGSNTNNLIEDHYGPSANFTISTGTCQCGSSTVTPECSVTYECCVCEDGCPPVEPPARGECLTLWLHADRMDSIETIPAYPVNPPNLGGTTYYIKEWHNLAYDTTIGVYPYDPTAFYTYDTITPDFTTAPILDLTTFAPHKAIMFDEIGNNQKFLIANPVGPAVIPLEPDTNPNTNYDKGWTIFFRRCTTETGWINAKSWFMGDDWTQTTPAGTEKASGLKPEGQPYCRSVMLGHNHANESVPSNQYKASYINENNPAGGDLYLLEGCYTHWVKACETKPTGTAGNTFDVTWGIGPLILFKDTMTDVTMDMILQNINTRNRDKSETQAGWYQEIRAYNCCFDKYEVKAEFTSIDNYWGNTLTPQQLPPPCGGGEAQVGNVIKFDGVDQTRVEVVEAGGNETILPSNEGFTAAFWVRMDDCVDDDACFFEKGINLPTDNEQVAFRLFMTDDAGNAGRLFWDVFGDEPVSYLGNYGRTISTVTWLDEADCATLVGKWKHIAVTMDGISGTNRKIYVNGVDVTGPTSSEISGKVRRNSNYPFNIGDSSRVDYTFKGEFSQFMTWNKSLSKGEIRDVYNNGAMWAPNTNVPSTMAEILGSKPYEDKDRLTFYTNFDSDPITHETQHTYTINKYGGVTLENTTDVDNAVLPTDISGLQCWFRADTKQLFDLDSGNNKISRATYMVGNRPHLKDKIRIWECHGNTGRYCMPDAVNTQAEKMLYQQTTEASALIVPGGLYSNGSKQLQIFHTKADGGIQFPAADGNVGAFTIMIKIRLEAFSNEAVYGNTTDNMMRVNNTTTVRYKIGGAGSSDYTVPSAMTDAQPYIFTLQRDVDGNLSAYIDGGAFTDQALTGSFTDTDAFVIDYLGGVPSQGMQGWIFDFLAWDTKLNDAQRKAQYRVINQTIRTL